MRALKRDRVDQLLNRAWEVLATVVVGPAGAGKTTAAVHLARSGPGPVLWYRASAVDGDEAQLSAHLAAAVAHAHGHEPTWNSLAETWDWLAWWAPPAGVLVVIDEFDAVIGEPAERALAAVLADAAPNVHTVVMSRRRPSLNLIRLRLAGLATEIGPDDLRFRSWEVDRLFRDLYGRPLAPDQVAELERRSGGWVAALQLFDLATAHLTPDAREATISRVGRRAGPDWEYLADNVLAGLSDEHRDFLLASAPLDRLDHDLCDELLGITSSARQLAELERIQLVTVAADDPGSCRCHEVLRAHLESLLVEREGEAAVRKLCATAGRLLEERGRYAEALRAFLRADERTGAERVLSARGGDLADRPGSWVDRLPPRLVQDDPWLLLARARQYRNDGRLGDAVATYERLEAVALSSALVSTARSERFVAAALADRRLRPPVPWIALLRWAAAGDVRAVSEQASGRAIEQLMIGLARLVAGDPRRAVEPLRGAGSRPDAPSPVVLAARLALTIAGRMSGDPDPDEAAALERMAAAHDLPFFTRLCGAVGRSMVGSRVAIAETLAACDHVGDEFGAALCEAIGAVLEVTGSGPRRDPGSPPAGSADRCRRLGLDGLAWWTELNRLVGSGDHDPPDAASDATSEPRAGAPGSDVARAIAHEARRRGAAPMAALAGAVATALDGGPCDAAGTIERLAGDHDLCVDVWLRSLVDSGSGDARFPPHRSRSGTMSATEVPARRDAPGPLTVRCFGGLEVAVDGQPVDLSGVRPRARSVLALLAARAGAVVHRDVICTSLWPDDEAEGATRKLHVAVSSIRKALRVATGQQLIERYGESYGLASPDGLTVDVAEFWRHTDAANAEIAAGRDGGRFAEEALRLRDDLLPEFGPVEWLVEPRRHIDTARVRLATYRAESLAAGGEPEEAASWCRHGLEIDPWSDQLWRLLLDTLDAAHDPAALSRARRDYEAMLADLGVD